MQGEKTYVEIKVRIESKTKDGLRRHVFARALCQNLSIPDAAVGKILDAIDEGLAEVTLEAKKEIE